MSLTGKKKYMIQKKKSEPINTSTLQKVNDLEKKIRSLKPQNIQHLKDKINRLEQKNRQLENSVKEMMKKKTPVSVNNNNEVRTLSKVINNDLNKIKLKIEKNESIIKKILFN